MSRTDNDDETVFSFDPCDRSATPIMSPSPPQSHDVESMLQMDTSPLRHDSGKGKSVSMPLPIAHTTHSYDPTDPFELLQVGSSMSYSAAMGYSNDASFMPGSSSILVGSVDSTWEPSTPLDTHHLERLLGLQNEDTIDVAYKGKDKAVDIPAFLPFLSFSPTGFDDSSLQWSPLAPTESTPGPSSFGSSIGSPSTSTNSPSPPVTPPAQNTVSPALTEEHSLHVRVPSRRHSFSTLSVYSTRSTAAKSLSRVKLRLISSSGNLSRKITWRKRALSNTPSSPSGSRSLVAGSPTASQSYLPWRVDVVPTSHVYSPLISDDAFPWLDKSIRSYPSSAPATHSYLFVETPLQTKSVRNLFDDLLPKELRIQVLRVLISLYETEFEQEKESDWSVSKASSSKNRWTGKNRAFKELVKLSRVSKSWNQLVFDGQLWESIDLRAFPSLPNWHLVRLTKMCGPFVTSLDLSGHARLSPQCLLELVDRLLVAPSTPATTLMAYTQLTSVNLRGCVSLTTRSLHHLIMRSPALETLCMRGLSAVTNTTLDILAIYCPRLACLDVSMCTNMTATGIRNLASAFNSRKEHMQLKELRASGLKYVDDDVMAALGRAAPFLEVLDLSYSRQLHNSAIEAFVACADHDTVQELGVRTVLLNAREAGRDMNDMDKYRRRVTRLRHLSLSSCVLLTDGACSNLAHSVPDLEFLELAGIGDDLKDDGVVRLLQTTPKIRRLDLEDAADISDAVIAAITPADDAGYEGPGCLLEHLVVSYATDLTDNAILTLIRRCERLTVLEVDNTRIGASVLREFVQLSRERKALNARIAAVDCRGIGEPLVKELSDSTRPRLGWAAYESRKLKYTDGRDGLQDLGLKGPVQDECDEERVVVKSFYSWQAVDAVAAAREKKRKAGTRRQASNDSTDSDASRLVTGGTRWWSPGGRRSGRNSPPSPTDTNSDGCTIM